MSPARPAVFSAESIHRAYLDCRRRKRGSPGAIAFESRLADEIVSLERELQSRTYRPGPGVRFVVSRPKPREIVAAPFRDRVVHHLLIRALEPSWERVFLDDSYACRPGRGTHAAVDRLERFVRSVTRGGRRRAFFLKADVSNYFMSVDRLLLLDRLDRRLRKRFGLLVGTGDDPRQGFLPLAPAAGRRADRRRLEDYRNLRWLCGVLILHDPLRGSEQKGEPGRWRLVPARKTLSGCGPGRGLPIGNLTSQFFGNVFLDSLDRFVKHVLKARYYLRYVDDFVLLHDERGLLERWLAQIQKHLEVNLRLGLNRRRTILRPVSCGIDFLGYVVHQQHRLVRRRVVGNLRSRLDGMRKLLARRLVSRDREYDLFVHPLLVLEKLLATLNSYLAHMAKADTGGLLDALWRKNPWLHGYFELQGHKVSRLCRPPAAFDRLSRQYAWFSSRAGEGLLLFQVGRFFELFDDQADAFGPLLGLQLIRPRHGFRSRCGFHAGHLPGFTGTSIRRLRRASASGVSSGRFLVGFLDSAEQAVSSGRGPPRVLRLGVPVTVVIEGDRKAGRVAGRSIAARFEPRACRRTDDCERKDLLKQEVSG